MSQPIRIQKIRDSAKGEACTLNFDGCMGKHPSVVFCHSNYNFHNKGASQKADDIFGCYGCSNCHDKYDGRKEDREAKLSTWPEFKYDKFYRAMCLTWQRLIHRGILK